ncbi:hypothetical protein F2Q69_00009877 [Brassica cretica]|uniref:Uncharacterized protein n=1 Tax=Brassica cretica TaxID=69181 RepID=A0A8S9P942_BRACR|nr:hypothetical protein F2Q69_00009877 [Brassica cretica]
MAPTASRDKRARTCESSEERLPVPVRVPRLLALKRCGRAYGFDLDFNSDPPSLIEPEWGEEYDIGLYGRIGLHNLQKDKISQDRAKLSVVFNRAIDSKGLARGLKGMGEKESSEIGRRPTIPTASRDKRARTCESSEERLPVPERVPRLLALKRCGRAYGFDLDFNSDPPSLIEPEWGEEYDIGLYGRIGLQCHNLQKEIAYGPPTTFRRNSDGCKAVRRYSVGIVQSQTAIQRSYIFVGNGHMVRRNSVGKYRRNSDDFAVNRNVVGNSSEYTDELPTTTTVTFFIGMSSKSRRKIPTNHISSEFRRKRPTEFRRLNFFGFGRKFVSIPSQISDDLGVRRNSVCFLVV